MKLKSLAVTNLILTWLQLALPLSAQTNKAPVATPLSDQERSHFQQELQSLERQIEQLPAGSKRADVAIFAKGLAWALRYDQEFSAADVKLLNRAVEHGKERLESLTAGKTPWRERRGKVTLGYVSTVDGSVQPYGVIVPANYDPAKPIRLDVVLHGSSRPVGMSELRFMARFDQEQESPANATEQPFLELHPLGRVENCYRWSGETDVFEAIADVQQRYKFDPDRIVLRGMSMGASGTWHLGLKHPDRFVALGPYCGYVDTHRFSETPLANFVRVGPLPEHQERGLHMLDSVDYAANAGVVPAIACMGEKDVFFQAHVIMGEAMQREGLKMVNLISPGTGHTIDPVTHKEQMRLIAEYAERGINHRPKELRFVTWTLKYPRCHWVQLQGLDRHYERAEFAAKLSGDRLEIAEPRNINRFEIVRDQLPAVPQHCRIGTQEIAWPTKKDAGAVTLVRDHGSWKLLESSSLPRQGKRPGVQGPIDDAFTTPFLCVRGTGEPWNPAAQAYAHQALARFADEWQRYFRGELPVKDDSAVTSDDVRTRNLILFGDPGSNRWISKALPSLPLKWNRDELVFAGKRYSATEHLPALITASPFEAAENRYLVINSGHTFRGADLGKLNYLLFPRWGDWAVLKIAPRSEDSANLEEVLDAGYFDERWKPDNGERGN